MTTYANADSQISAISNFDIPKQISSAQAGKHLSINLEEHVGVSVNQPHDQPSNQNVNQYASQKFISLSENVSILTSNLDHNAVMVIKESCERLTTLEKISNNERIRFNGRTITVLNENFDRTSYELQNVLTNSIKLISQKIDQPIIQIFYKTDLLVSFDDINTQFLQPTTTGFYTITGYIAKDVGIASHDLSSTTMLLLLVPLSGYILLRSEEEKISYNKNQIFSFCFILLLVTSSAVTPFAISQNYWGMAFAEPQNQTAVNNTVSNVSSTVANVTGIPANNTVQSSNQTISNISNKTSFAIPNYLSYGISSNLGL